VPNCEHSVFQLAYFNC